MDKEITINSVRPNNSIIFRNITNWNRKNDLSFSGTQERNKVVNVPLLRIDINDFVNKRGETVICDGGVNKAIN